MMDCRPSNKCGTRRVLEIGGVWDARGAAAKVQDDARCDSLAHPWSAIVR